MNILEAKLSAEHRKKISDNDFGLPSERKFPINDESHVRSAIMFFKYAKPNQRRELAKNINLKLKKFDMKVKVGENNLFYKYIDRNYLSESAIGDNILIEASITYDIGSIDNNIFDKFICKLINAYKNELDENIILNLEKEAYEILQTNTDTGNNLVKFMDIINGIFEYIYYDYITYYNYDKYADVSTLFYSMLNDVRNTIKTKILNIENKDITKELKIYDNFINTLIENCCDANKYYIQRIDFEISSIIMNDKNILVNYTSTRKYPTNSYNNKVILKYRPSDFMLDNDIAFESVKKELLSYKKQLTDELYIIKMNNNINPFINNKMHSLYQIDNQEIINKIDNISNVMDVNNRFFDILKNVSFTINEEDKLRLTHTKYVHTLISSKFYEGKIYWFGTGNNDELYIVCKDTNTDRVIYKLLLINDICYDYLLGKSFDNTKVTIINLTFPINNDIDYNLEKVTEGLSINDKGDIKITINPRKSYMDEYAEAHRILVENYKNKNYEAMKQNVAFMFLLISIIERDIRYKNREPEIVKARAFAINDFKTYLAYIQKKEPSFNFEKYYRESHLDEYIINIPKETIIGIKNLLKTILL